MRENVGIVGGLGLLVAGAGGQSARVLQYVMVLITTVSMKKYIVAIVMPCKLTMPYKKNKG